MNSSFSAFPRGLNGAALLLLRVSVSLVLIVQSDTLQVPSVVLRLVPFALAAALAAGFFTQAAAILAALIITVEFIVSDGSGRFILGLHSPVALALAAMGAGAYSIDAIWFGRRVINLGK